MFGHKVLYEDSELSKTERRGHWDNRINALAISIFDCERIMWITTVRYVECGTKELYAVSLNRDFSPDPPERSSWQRPNRVGRVAYGSGVQDR